ncbi:monooxygenase [Geodermatophilus sp. TF02-6]|uniref:flavin-containing monooxygenase n=1 Tax=Geodermatophilus sp. TF02-6 TaxID=2250575 RepID=UPI000DE95201|nr:NAD(P)/FAD-dependent oxidoreductase [Geodermatophilus sp. TF02-6]RBY82976.1 monooxygenase [Geodermatophilus sp. TF02-6]
MSADTSALPFVAPVDKDSLRRKYAEERDKRLRPDGLDQYVRLTGRFAHFAEDPHQPVVEREPVTDHVTFAFIGGGFAGLTAGARLKEAGIDDIRIIDKAGDFGGAWYWNRYPGVMCDTASLIYMPLLEETGYVPTEKYAHGPEILEHCRRIGRHYSLYEKALFHTGVTELVWDEDAARWIISTDRGDRFTAQFAGMGIGPLNVPKLPGIPGMDEFAGHSFHSSRWDYAYTGGDPAGAPMEKLRDKKVAIIGTGATSLQCVPALARDAQELYVIQRTPTAVDVRGNGPIDPEWHRSIATPGWQKRWLANFTLNWEGFTGQPPAGVEVEDLVQDGWTELGRRMRANITAIPPEEFSVERMMAAVEEADIAKMEQIRGRVDDVVTDPETAAKLKPWYPQLCKRPGFHDEYLQAFNRHNTHLIDTDGKGVERLTERGVVAGGVEYEVDCVIYASGFEYATDYTQRAGFDVTGRDGVTLSKAWADGMRTLHGMHVHGLPNLFIVQLLQGAFLGSNVPHGFAESAQTIAAIVCHAVAEGARAVEVTDEAQTGWVEMLLRDGVPFGRPDCTPGYYNNEGQEIGLAERLNVGYPLGATAFFGMIDDWRTSGEFEGLAFR